MQGAVTSGHTHQPGLGPHALLQETLGSASDELVEPCLMLTGAMIYAFRSWYEHQGPTHALAEHGTVIGFVHPSLSQVHTLLFYFVLGGVPSGAFCLQW